MSLIRTETRDTKRAADPLHDLRSKPFSEWGEDEIRRFNLIDALLEFVYTDTSSPFGIGMTFDYTECWEIGVRDDCLVMTRVKPVLNVVRQADSWINPCQPARYLKRLSVSGTSR